MFRRTAHEKPNVDAGHASRKTSFVGFSARRLDDGHSGGCQQRGETESNAGGKHSARDDRTTGDIDGASGRERTDQTGGASSRKETKVAADTSRTEVSRQSAAIQSSSQPACRASRPSLVDEHACRQRQPGVDFET